MKNNIEKIISLGSSLNLDFVLSLTRKEFLNFNLDFNSIKSLMDLKKYLEYNEEENYYSSKKNNKSLLNLITINSKDSLFNSLLYINRANKKKSFIELLIPFFPKYSKELEFMNDSLKFVLENNYLFLEYFNVFNIKPNLNFVIKLIDDNQAVLKTKQFLITNENKYEEENIKNENDVFDLFDDLNFEYDGTIFYTNFLDLYKCKKKSNFEIETFLKKIVKFYPSMKICINYINFIYQFTKLEIQSLNTINEIISLTDILIFEKKELKEFFQLIKIKDDEEKKIKNKKKKIKKSYSQSELNISINNKNKIIDADDLFMRKIETKKKQKNRIGILFEELKTITIIEQDSFTKMVLYHMKYEINYLEPNLSEEKFNEYKKISNDNFDYLKSIFIGGYLSRLFNHRNFNTCFVAGNESIKNIIYYLKNKFDLPKDKKYYEIKVRKAKSEKSEKELMNEKKENNFILDCTNINNSRKKEYNSLFDSYCISFLGKENNRKFLLKRGFINKNGYILNDPDKQKFSITIRKKRKIINYDKQQNKLYEINSNNKTFKNQLKSLIFNYPIENNSTIEPLLPISKVYNFELQYNKKLPSININKYYFKTFLRKNSSCQDIYKKKNINNKSFISNNFNKEPKPLSSKNIESDIKFKDTYKCQSDIENNEEKINLKYLNKSNIYSRENNFNNFVKKNSKHQNYMSHKCFQKILSSFEKKL